ncbi:MAG: biotin--[acetyl-CoA-carboxylase] ligase [bacterium]|nr:biotin--[acetyl-CoA-carboxylase] ligase [bacterium]
MDISLIRKELLSKDLLSEIIYFEETPSTNNYANQNSEGNDKLILTSNQTSGRGRFSRQWISTPGKDLTFTIIKNLKLKNDEIHLVNFYTSYILYLTLKECLSESSAVIGLKWPNDILMNAKKVAGILSEVKHLKNDTKKFIIGAGINVNSTQLSPEIKSKATSILIGTGTAIKIETLLIHFIKLFYKNLLMINSGKELMSRWSFVSGMEGIEINFLRDGSEDHIAAKVIGIEPDGSLSIRSSSGKTENYFTGEISIEV